MSQSDYSVVTAKDLPELAQGLTLASAAGWDLVGGIVTGKADSPQAFSAMVARPATDSAPPSLWPDEPAPRIWGDELDRMLNAAINRYSVDMALGKKTDLPGRLTGYSDGWIEGAAAMSQWYQSRGKKP